MLIIGDGRERGDRHDRRERRGPSEAEANVERAAAVSWESGVLGMGGLEVTVIVQVLTWTWLMSAMMSSGWNCRGRGLLEPGERRGEGHEPLQ